MTDAQTLLHRITAFRERLQVPPSDGEPTRSAALAEVAPPPPLTARARRLLEDARGLVAKQRELASSPHLVRAHQSTTDGPRPKSLSDYHKATVAMIDAAMTVAQRLPAAPDAQLRLCGGLDAIFTGVRARQDALEAALNQRSRHATRVDGLARRLSDLAARRLVDFDGFGRLAADLLDDARQGAPLDFPPVDPSVGVAHAVAAHAVAVAAVVARIAPLDFEWAARPDVAVVAALVMDVGLLQVPAEVYFHAGPLDAASQRLIESHPEAGARVLRQLFGDADGLAEAVATHHERPDGTGYPAGVGDETMPTLAKLLNACDAYATLRTARPGRPARDPRTALMETLSAAELGRHDRESAELLATLGVYPVGTVVELADGRTAVVAANHPHRANVRAASRPVLAVVADADARPLQRPEFLDLAATDRGSIARTLSRQEAADLLAAEMPEFAD